MRKLVIAFVILAAFGFATPTASAGPFLFEWRHQSGRNRLRLSISPAAVPGNWSFALFDTATGLGTATATVTGAGIHNVLFFLDIEIDEAINTFFNEFGSVIGAPGAGLSWEIDEPGFGGFGDIYANFVAGALDSTNGVPSVPPTTCRSPWAGPSRWPPARPRR